MPDPQQRIEILPSQDTRKRKAQDYQKNWGRTLCPPPIFPTGCYLAEQGSGVKGALAASFLK
jgi:hypothetical protein